MLFRRCLECVVKSWTAKGICRGDPLQVPPLGAAREGPIGKPSEVLRMPPCDQLRLSQAPGTDPEKETIIGELGLRGVKERLNPARRAYAVELPRQHQGEGSESER